MSSPEILIAYFSHRGQNYVNGEIVDLPMGNTEVVAKKLQNMIGDDLVHIEQQEIYPEDYPNLRM